MDLIRYSRIAYHLAEEDIPFEAMLAKTSREPVCTRTALIAK